MAMPSPPHFPRVVARFVEPYRGEFISLTLWVTGIWFFGMAYDLTGGRTIRDDEVVTFRLAFAMASAIASVTALAVAGRVRWALGAAVCFSLAGFILIGAAVSLSWLAVPRFPGAVFQVAEAAIVTGVFMGAGLGLIAGLLVLLARRWPRLIGWLVAGLLAACVARFVHISAFDSVIQYAMAFRIGRDPGAYFGAYRVFFPASLGACAGAVVGAAGACAVLWWSGRRQPAAGSGEPGAESVQAIH
jgi:hypothetical protein